MRTCLTGPTPSDCSSLGPTQPQEVRLKVCCPEAGALPMHAESLEVSMGQGATKSWEIAGIKTTKVAEDEVSISGHTAACESPGQRPQFRKKVGLLWLQAMHMTHFNFSCATIGSLANMQQALLHSPHHALHLRAHACTITQSRALLWLHQD